MTIRQVVTHCESVMTINDNLNYLIDLHINNETEGELINQIYDLNCCISESFRVLYTIAKKYYTLCQTIDELPEFVFDNYFLVIYLLDRIAYLSNDITRTSIDYHKPYRNLKELYHFQNKNIKIKEIA